MRNFKESSVEKILDIEFKDMNNFEKEERLRIGNFARRVMNKIWDLAYTEGLIDGKAKRIYCKYCGMILGFANQEGHPILDTLKVGTVQTGKDDKGIIISYCSQKCRLGQLNEKESK